MGDGGEGSGRSLAALPRHVVIIGQSREPDIVHDTSALIANAERTADIYSNNGDLAWS